jgi:hypothetical protein
MYWSHMFLLTQFHRSNRSLAHCRNLVLADGLEGSATPDAMVFGLPVCIAAPLPRLTPFVRHINACGQGVKRPAHDTAQCIKRPPDLDHLSHHSLACSSTSHSLAISQDHRHLPFAPLLKIGSCHSALCCLWLSTPLSYCFMSPSTWILAMSSAGWLHAKRSPRSWSRACGGISLSTIASHPGRPCHATVTSFESSIYIM